MANQMLMEGAIAVILLVLVVAIGATVLQGVRDTQVDSNPVITGTVVNETLAAAVSGRNYVLDDAPSYSRHLNVSVTVQNATSNPNVLIANYSFLAANKSITVLWTGGQFNVSYTYEFDSVNADVNISSAGLSALITYSNFFTVIVVTLVFAAIIGLFVLFAARGRGTQGGL